MAGDFSRQTHDPRKRFAAVLMQQGRVQIDADWNEQGAIALERARRQARDTFGRAAVSRFSTADAFRIGIVAGPPRDLSIAPGRMYVEGHLAEAFAADGTPISYLRQPFLPDPPALPASGGAVVFLDVWQREVTWIEDPSLLDVALGGVDTAARLQTVWQVRVAAERQPACGMDPDALLPPSPARLTTRAVAPPAPEDPCLIAPKTGYRGLENRLYRVEVHTGGPTGAARFKFSRDNASVRSPVTAIRREMRGGREVSILTVSRIGRDPGLRIAAGDWVEITDEHRFLNGESGAMAQVAEPPLEEAGLDGFAVVLDRAIPASGERGFATTAAGHEERRTRIIRWDQAAPRNSLDQNGLMAVAGGMIALEEGIEVDFTLSGGTQYRAGDYWMFAARTADASVEVLTAAAPHGPIHHAAQLAAITSIAGDADPSDCRTLWPPLAPQGGDGCCTVVVRPGEDVQAAIDSLPDAGGCVCLKAGIHPLRAALLIRRSRVSLHAEAPGAAVLTRAAETPLLVIGAAQGRDRVVADVTVAGVVFQVGSIAERTVFAGLVSVEASAERVHLSHCRFRVQDAGGRAPAVHVRGRDVTVEASVVERLAFGVIAEDSAADLVVRDCAFIAEPADEAADRGAAALPDFDAGFAAVAAVACAGRLTVTGNAVTGYRHGILAGGEALGSKGLRTTVALIAGNVVLRGGPRQAAEPDPATLPGRDTAVPPVTAPTRPEPPRGAAEGATRTIDVAAVRERLAEGTVRLSAGERVVAMAERPAGLSAAAAPMLAMTERLSVRLPEREPGRDTGLQPVGEDGATFAFAIFSAAQNASVIENVIAWRGGPYGGILAGGGTRLVAGNDLVIMGGDATGRGIGGTRAGMTDAIIEPGTLPGIGIASGAFGAGAADAVEVAGNMVTGPGYAVALSGVEAGVVRGNIAVNALAGVIVVGGEGMRVAANGLFGCALGVMAREAPRVSISENLVGASHGYGIVALHGGRVAAGLVRIAGNVLLRCGVREERAVALLAMVADLTEPEAPVIASAELVVEANRIEDTGWSPGGEARARAAVAMQLAAPRVTVAGNDVTWGQPARSDAGVRLLTEERGKPNRALVVTPLAAAGLEPLPDRSWAGSVTITGNRLRGPSADTLVEVTEGPANAGGTRFMQLLFSANTIEHWSPLDSQGARATVELRAMPEALVSVSANVIRASGRTPSVRVDGPKEIAWAGNATSGQLIGAAGRANVVA
jgi:hypothetical protein